LRVLLVDQTEDRANLIITELTQLGCVVVQHSTDRLLRAVSQQRPDVIIIDIDSPDRDTLESLTTLNSLNPLPVVMFSAQQDTAVIQQAIEAGVSAYVVDGLNPGRVKPILDTAIARFKQYRNLQDTLRQTQERLEVGSMVARAKRLLIKHHGLDEPSAYRALCKIAMDQRQPIEKVARNAIDWFKVRCCTKQYENIMALWLPILAIFS
jgi:response regulator NasT